MRAAGRSKVRSAIRRSAGAVVETMRFIGYCFMVLLYGVMARAYKVNIDYSDDNWPRPKSEESSSR